jgi:hypothetical protein
MLPSLGDAIDNGTLDDPYKDDPIQYDYETFENGNVKIIRVIPRDEEKLEMIDDEKLESL